MITEIAQIEIKPGSEFDFEAAVAKARATFGRAKGFHGFELHRSIEGISRSSGSSECSSWSVNLLRLLNELCSLNLSWFVKALRLLNVWLREM